MKFIYKILSIMLILTFLASCGVGKHGQPNTIPETRTAPSGDALQKDLYESWPTENFKTGTPESVGVDSLAIQKRIEKLVKGNKTPDSFLIMRKGVLINETYFRGNSENTRHQLYSVTKSFISALVGIAIAEGKIKGVEQKVSDFYPDVKLTGANESKKNMTIEHLLTMTSGVVGEDDFTKWDDKDIGKAIFEAAQKSEPGTKYHYNNLATNLLAIIVSKAVNKNLFEYAKEKIFEPLGMKSVLWETDANGNNNGGYGLSMTSHDMLRFGYLYLNNGRWGEKQLIPADWIARTPAKVNEADAYGYLFWKINDEPDGFYEARGAYGQNISIFPSLDMVIVTTSSNGVDTGKLYKDIDKDMNDKPLPENKTAYDTLKKYSESFYDYDLPDGRDILKKAEIKEYFIGMENFISFAQDGEKSDVATTAEGMKVSVTGGESGIKTDVKFGAPFILDFMLFPDKDNISFEIQYGKGKISFWCSDKNHYLTLSDYVTGESVQYVAEGSYDGSKALTLRWLLGEEYQAVVFNEKTVFYLNDNPYENVLGFRQSKANDLKILLQGEENVIMRLNIGKFE